MASDRIFADKQNIPSNNRRRVAYVTSSGDIILWGAHLKNIVTSQQAFGGDFLPADYPPGEVYIGSDVDGSNGFMLLSLPTDHSGVAVRHYQFSQ